MRFFKASWSTALHVISWSATLVCLAAAVAGAPVLRQHGLGHLASWLPLLPLALIAGCALFTVRGYVVTPDAILVRRLFWHTAIPRAGLQSAAPDPEAMKWAIRTWGNGGFYSFTGFYWTRRLRSFRAFVTDPRNAVALRFADRTIVLSPDDPGAFLEALR